MNEIKLLPCPFCGSTKIEIWHSSFGVSVKCEECGANSGWKIEPNEESKEKAVMVWNRRVDNG